MSNSEGQGEPLDNRMDLNNLSNPLGLRKFRKNVKPWFPFLPMVDFCAMTCLLILLSNQIIFTPGVSIDLPKSEDQNQTSLTSMGVLTIITGTGTDKILFDGYMWNLTDPNFLEALKEFDQKNFPRETYLLVKMDRKTPGQTIHDLSSLARIAGIERLHIATERSE
jgi:biopolymer transport protein ExbD